MLNVSPKTVAASAIAVFILLDEQMRFQRIDREEASCIISARNPGMKTLDAAEDRNHRRGPQPREAPVAEEVAVGNVGRFSQD